MPETQNIEYKSSWHDDYLDWICGFANAQGGKIYIGIDDKGDIVGVENSHELSEKIPNKIRNAMGITADRLKSLGLIDYIVPEPLGGAHRDMEAAAQMLGEAIETNLRELKIMPLDKLMDKRYQRIMSFGQFEE